MLWTKLKRKFPWSKKHLLLAPISVLVLLGFVANYANVMVIYPSLSHCIPKRNIFFLKTHKCAGSSIQNILMRYGEKHRLNFVLPMAHNYLGHPMPFHRSMLPRLRPDVYNVFTHHTRLNYTEVRHLMPVDTIFVTIVRDPVDLFESAYDYYSMAHFYNVTLHQFANLTSEHDSEMLRRRYWGRFGINQMIFDLGAGQDIFWNQTLVEKYVDQVESWFDLVLLADKISESLVLLKNLMCWETDDVVAFKLNALNPRYKSNLTDDERVKLRKLNAADQILYERFSKKFGNQIAAFGAARMAKESAELKKRTQKWYDYCVQSVEPERMPKRRPRYYLNTKTMKFKRRANSNRTCRFLTEPELSFTDYLRRRQRRKLLKNRVRQNAARRAKV